MRNVIRKFMDALQINKADLSATTTEAISEELDRALRGGREMPR
jgi:ribosomal protein S20